MKRILAAVMAALFLASIVAWSAAIAEGVKALAREANVPPISEDGSQPEQGATGEIQPAVKLQPQPICLDKLNRIEGCTVTYYCCEAYEHICGTGDGYTATGTPVTAGRSCAVDPLIIPLGSRVWVDFGDGALHAYVAEDVGAAVQGGHIDLAVETHAEALECGVDIATVYWEEGK